MWIHDGLYNRERSLCKKTVDKPDNNTIAIHSYYQYIGINSVYKRAAGKAEETAKRVPGHIVTVDRENSAISDNGKDYKHNKGEETHAGFEGGVIMGKLEEDQDYIYRDEDCGSAYSGYSKEDKHSPRLKNSIRKTRRLVVVKMA